MKLVSYFSLQSLALATAGLAGLVACSTAVPTGTPGVDQVGQTVLRYRGPEVDVVLSYRFAEQRMGEDWLMLDLALTGITNASVEVNRDKISLLTPAGEEVPLPTQQEFAAAYASLGAAIHRANVAAEPLDYYAGRVPCAMPFLVAPGDGLAVLSVWVNDRRVCQGRLYFLIPGGVQPGRHLLKIALPESEVRIPFVLEDE